MLILLKTMIVIFRFEMSFVIYVWFDHFVFLPQLLQSTMHIYLQARCNNFSKQRIQKQLYTLENGKGQCLFREQGYNVHVLELPMMARYVCNTIFFCWILHGIIIVHYVLLFVSNFIFLFIVVTTSVITTHWSLFLMRLVSTMPCQTMMWCSL